MVNLIKKAKDKIMEKMDEAERIRDLMKEMDDIKLKEKAIREGEPYATEYVRRQKAIKDLERRIKQ